MIAFLNEKGKPTASTGLGDKIRIWGLDILFEMPVRFPLDLSSKQLDTGIQS